MISDPRLANIAPSLTPNLTMKILIVDDEQPARDRLKRLLADSAEFVVAGEADNGSTALEMAGRLKPDAVLLDISMPGLDGIETARHLNLLPEPPAIIFATAYDEYAVEAFDALAVGYVLKPVRQERLLRALAQAHRLSPAKLQSVSAAAGQPGPRQQLGVSRHNRIVLVPVNSIFYFSADQKYVRVRHEGGEDLLSESLKALEEEFSAGFVRLHRSTLVALSMIEALDKSADGYTQARLRTINECLPVSRRHVAAVRRRLREGR